MMGELIEARSEDYSLEPDQAWKGRLQSAQHAYGESGRRTVEEYLNFCRVVWEFRQNCEKAAGGSQFSELGREWLGLAQPRLAEMSAVGKRAPELIGAPISLPNSIDSINRLCMLDDVGFRKAMPRLSTEMPQSEVRQLIKDVNPPRQLTQAEQDEKVRAKRDRIVKQWMQLPKKHKIVAIRDMIRTARVEGLNFDY